MFTTAASTSTSTENRKARRARRITTRRSGAVAAATAATLCAGLLSITAVSATSAAAATAGQLLQHDGFESASTVPAGYTANSTVGVAIGTAAEEGSGYARVTSTSPTTVPVGVVAGAPVTGIAVGANLLASCWVRTNNFYPASLHLSETAPDGTVKTQERVTTTSTAWKQVSFNYTTVTASSKITISAYATGLTAANKGGLGVDNCTLTALSTPPPAAPVAPAIPTTVPTGFTRAFTQDFNTPAPVGSFDTVYGSQFSEYTGCCTTNGVTQYAPDKVLSVANGSLFYNLHSENGTSYSAAPVPGKYLNFTYGQVGMSIRLAASVGTGYKLAFLLWPQTNAWTNEVDFPEVYPDFSQNMYAASVQTTTPTGAHVFSGGPGSASTATLSDNQYHTFLLDWRPGIMTATIDGKTVATFTGNAVPAQAMHEVLQTEGWINQGAVPAASTASIEVPYIYINTMN